MLLMKLLRKGAFLRLKLWVIGKKKRADIVFLDESFSLPIHLTHIFP